MKTYFGNADFPWLKRGVIDDTINLSVLYCGYQYFSDDSLSIVRKTGRLDYQIIYVIDGKIEVVSPENETLLAKRGNLILFKKDDPQIYHYLSKNKPKLYWLHFSGNTVEKYLDELNLNKTDIYKIQPGYFYEGAFEEIINELQIKLPLYKRKAASLLESILTSCARDILLAQNSMIIENKDILRTIESMNLKFNQNISINKYAKECNLSIFAYINKFKKITGKTPKSYLLEVRLDHAKRLLCQTDMPISAISNVIGYKDVYYFSQSFKNSMNVSPSKYRKAAKLN